MELCVCALLEKGMHEEGLLRVGCGAYKIKTASYVLFVYYYRELYQQIVVGWAFAKIIIHDHRVGPYN